MMPELLANGFDDVDFLEDCHGGFPFVGELPPVKYGTNPSSKKLHPISVQEVVDHTQYLNEDLIASVRSSEWQLDVLDQMRAVADVGWMTEPQFLEGPPHEVAHSISVEAFRSVSTEIA